MHRTNFRRPTEFKPATLRGLYAQQDRIVMAEVADEAEYVKHHPQKIALIFSAMRHRQHMGGNIGLRRTGV